MENFLRSRQAGKLINKDIPLIATSLETIAGEMKKANKLKELEIEILRRVHRIGPEYR